MKKVLLFCVVVVMMLALAACNGNDKAQDPGKDVDDPKKVVLRLGMTAEADSHYGKGAKVFADKVAEYTGGQVEVQIFPSSQLGNERDLVEGVGVGTIEMCLTSTGPLPNFSSDFMLFDLPFIVTDRQKAYEVMDGTIGQEILGSLAPMGIKALGFWENGFRNITNNRAPIVSPEDVRGMKIRTMENPIHLETFRHLGAQPTPMAWGEVFIALQQGTIDGQENPLVILYTAKIYEVQKHVSLTGHFYSPAVMSINKNLFDGFSADIQEAILKAEKEARDWERQYSAQLDTELVQTLTDAGMIVTEVDKDEWQRACAPVYEKFMDKIKPEYIEALLGQ
ncbi:TRAP transporter substrate-binding protein [Desulfitibacter alkalitolerans]|uniref:TRAP transporter substrate-binding protein n=1 Tax=Desulfitibacter alkalitolerans TaxID=264641 RepID=UPI0004861B0E|nr:TRAP transporter substrate-binding protein [Desulfitibacter alkalitolerans]